MTERRSRRYGGGGHEARRVFGPELPVHDHHLPDGRGPGSVRACSPSPRPKIRPSPFPRFTVVAVYPGATPSDMEQLVVDPIEQRINELEDLRKLQTRDPGRAGGDPGGVRCRRAMPIASTTTSCGRSTHSGRAPGGPGAARHSEVRRQPGEHRAGGTGLRRAAGPCPGGPGPCSCQDRLERVPGVRTVERWGSRSGRYVVELDAGRRLGPGFRWCRS